MSFTDSEDLQVIIKELEAKLPKLKELINKGYHIETLHGTVEMISALINRYKKGEIIEKEK